MTQTMMLHTTDAVERFGEIPHPVSVPSAVDVSATHTSINPNYLYMRNPAFEPFWFRNLPLPRSAIALPTLISPTSNATDQTLFEEPLDPTKKHVLVPFAIGTLGSGSTLQQNVSFAPSAAGYVLTVHLTSTPPTTGAPINPTAARYMLSANLQGQAASWDFETATADGNNLVLSHTVTDPEVRNAIYHAMTDPTAQAKLVLRRSFVLAEPVVPVLTPGQPTPAPAYHVNTVAIDTTVPFTFDPTLDKNVFAGLTNVGNGVPSWSIQQVPWQGRTYPYYQDLNLPAQVYFLPDAFKISRQASAPHAPSIVVTTDGDDPASITFTMTFLAVPVWNRNRITAAAQALQTTLGLSALPVPALFEASNTALSLTVPATDAAAAPGLVAQPGASIDIASGIKCSIALTMAQFRQVYAALFEAVTQLLSGVVSVTVGGDVEQIPFTSSAADFAGELFVTTSTFDPLENVLTVVVENAIESPLHVTALPAVLTKAGVPMTGVTSQLKPAPPLDLHPVPVTTAAGTPAPDSITVAMQLSPGTAVDSTCQVQFDYTGVTVIPDPTAIWAAIMQNQVVAPVKRTINVILFESVFAPTAIPAPAGGGALPVLQAVQVVFDDGQTANFDASTPAVNGVCTQTISLAVPIAAYILQTGDTTNYTYRVDTITTAGTHQGTPVTSNQDSFYVQMTA